MAGPGLRSFSDYTNPVFTTGGRNFDTEGNSDGIGNEAKKRGSGGGTAEIAGAGIQAGGQLVSTLANIIGQKSVMDQQAQQNDLSRASSLKLANMQLASDQGIFDSRSKAQAMQSLLAALANSGNMAQAAHDTQRYGNTSGNTIMDAFTPSRR